MDYNIHMNKYHGLTLIELIVTLAVFGILIAIAAPSFTAYTDSSRRVSYINNISGTLSFARSEAIKRGSSISVCARTAGAETCSGGNDWKNGWLIFTDTNANGVLDVGDSLLRLFDPLHASSVITETTGQATAAITFRPSGFISASKATYKYCGNSGTPNVRAVIVSKTGRARISFDSNDADSIHENELGNNMACP